MRLARRFFESLARHLAEALGADYALVGERIPGNAGRVRTLAAFANGRIAPELEYDLAGTPCENLLQKSLCVYPAQISHLFPRDLMLSEMGAEAYAGTPLLASDGAVLGLIAVLYRKPLADCELVQAVLKIFAGRAAAEVERKQAEEALRESERRYQEFILRSAEGVWRLECDPPIPLSLPSDEVLHRYLHQARFAELNDEAARLAGLDSAQDLLGKRLIDWEGVTPRLELMRQQVRDGFPARRFHFQLTEPQGRVRWFDRKEVPIVENGELLRLWGATRDMTDQQLAQKELQESGDRYRTLLEAAGDAIFVLSDEVVDCNSHGLAMFGGTREQLMGQTSWSLSPEFQPDGRNSREKCAEKVALVAQGQTVTFEWRHRRLDGECFDADVTLSPVTIGGVPHRMALIEDITGRKKAEAQLRDFKANLERLVADRTAQLEAANQEMEAFSYSVSHHLRAAIHSISVSSQTVLDGYGGALDATGRQWLEHINADSQELEKLTLALLELSQVSRASLHRSNVDLSSLARATAQRLSQSHRERHAEFRIADGLSVQGDPVLLRVVIENLVGNAWKFTRTRPVAEIEIGARDGTFFVRDNGVGFDMKYADKLFRAFQRLHRSEEFEGTGIGLATVRRVIHRHGGRVWAEGAVDKGDGMNE